MGTPRLEIFSKPWPGSISAISAVTGDCGCARARSSVSPRLPNATIEVSETYAAAEDEIATGDECADAISNWKTLVTEPPGAGPAKMNDAPLGAHARTLIGPGTLSGAQRLRSRSRITGGEAPSPCPTA